MERSIMVPLRLKKKEKKRWKSDNCNDLELMPPRSSDLEGFTTIIEVFQMQLIELMSIMDSNSKGGIDSEFTENKEINLTNDLSHFLFKRILSDNRDTKSVVVEGSFTDKSGSALLILEKDSFQEDNLRNIFREENLLEHSFHNDIYYGFRYLPNSTFNGIKATLVYPATEKHIKKYEQYPVHLVNETPELYYTVTLPFIKSEQFSLQWVFNILEHKSETDRIIYEDPDPDNGFILCSDLKWDGKSIETLYLLALPFKKGIMSMRDLTQDHLPLLKNIYNKGVKAIADKYSIPSTQLRVYCHYQPSFYHLHVHFTFLQYSAPGISTERAHLISTIINNLELMSNYYQISKLDFAVSENSALFSKYEAIGLLKRLPKKG